VTDGARMWMTTPTWFHPVAWRIDDWIETNPGAPMPVPRQLRHGLIMGVFMRYLELRGVAMVDGDLPASVRAQRVDHEAVEA
jgi:hypothetical protein